MVEKKKTTAKKVEKPTIKIAEEFNGKFTATTGRRKTATASIRLYEKGTGKILVNGKKLKDYFSDAQINIINQPIILTEVKYDFSISVQSGGKNGQAEAIQNGIAKALLKINPDWRISFKAKGWLTRDARRKERKKPGLKRARRAPQWSKR
ncbi:MAG: 30S ribosomal protein S9 [bacterium]